VLILAAVVPAASRVMASDGEAAVAELLSASLRWLYALGAIVLGALWLLAPDVTRLWLGTGHEPVAALIRLWVIAYAVNLAWSPAAAVARGAGKPWVEAWGFAVSLAANVAFGLIAIPRAGNPGALVALVASWAAGFAAYAIAARAQGVRFGPWISRELLPRAVAGTLAVAASGALAGIGPLARLVPEPGWRHALLTGGLFVPVFALCFLPLGDTQRLLRTAGQFAGLATRRRAEQAS